MKYFSPATELFGHKDTGIGEVACWRSKATKRALRRGSCIQFSQSPTELKSVDTHPNTATVHSQKKDRKLLKLIPKTPKSQGFPHTQNISVLFAQCTMKVIIYVPKRTVSSMKFMIILSSSWIIYGMSTFLVRSCKRTF